MDHTAYIALGSNVGDRTRHLTDAIAVLHATPGIAVLKVATPIETDPVDCPPDAEPFLNSAAELRTTLEPAALLTALLGIERSLGRHRSVRNAPRPIDLDLLLFGDRVLKTDTLELPHPRMHERAFVLLPLVEIAPEVVHPVLGKTIRELKDALPK